MLIVICSHRNGAYLPERDLCRCAWDETVADIVSGQITNVSQIIQTSTGQDVTESVARDVMAAWAERGEPLSAKQRDFIEQAVSVQAANKFRKLEEA